MSKSKTPYLLGYESFSPDKSPQEASPYRASPPALIGERVAASDFMKGWNDAKGEYELKVAAEEQTDLVSDLVSAVTALAVSVYQKEQANEKRGSEYWETRYAARERVCENEEKLRTLIEELVS